MHPFFAWHWRLPDPPCPPPTHTFTPRPHLCFSSSRALLIPYCRTWPVFFRPASAPVTLLRGTSRGDSFQKYGLYVGCTPPTISNWEFIYAAHRRCPPLSLDSPFQKGPFMSHFPSLPLHQGAFPNQGSPGAYVFLVTPPRFVRSIFFSRIQVRPQPLETEFIFFIGFFRFLSN